MKLETNGRAPAAAGLLIVTGTLAVNCAWVLILLASRMVVPVALAQTRPAVELERAITQEQVVGDLNASMAAYQRIAADASAPREVRAKALLQLAGCYEKLGREAADVYQRIVRDFADQPAASQARTRLAALKKDAGGYATNVFARKIETPSRSFDYTTDGRRVIYRDYAAGEMIYGDLAGRMKRVLLKFKPGEMSWWAPSKDLSMVAIAFAEKPDRPAHISIVKTDGTGERELVRNDERGRQERVGFDFVQWVSWSWDARDLLVSVSNRNVKSNAAASAGYLLVVSAADGKRRRLVDVQDGYAASARFSPDGRFVAYEVVHPGGPVMLRTYVMPATGGKPSLVHEEREPVFYIGLLDWTADGRHLAMTASAAIGPALHLFPVENGQAAGPPVLVRPGHFVAGNMWPSGALVSWLARAGGYMAHVASLGADGKPGAWQRLDFGSHSPMPPFVLNWSPDGQQIVYTARNEDVGQSGGAMVRVRNLITGHDREIHRSASRVGCAWGAASKLICGGPSAGDPPAAGMAMFSIATDSGAIEKLRPFPGIIVSGQPSRDGRFFYVGKGGASGGIGEFVRWEIETGRETVLERPLSPTSWFRVSADERWLIRSANLKVSARPTSGGDWNPLVTVNKAVAGASVFREFAVTPDSKWVVYRDVDPAGKHGLFRVPISGGASERLGDFSGPMGQLGILEFSPDGQRILAGVLGEEQRELWMLQNLVPASTRR